VSIDFDIAKLKLPNGRTIESQIKQEAERLKQLLQSEIDRWYSAYSPVVYPRSYNMRNSLYIDDVVNITSSGNQLTISIKFSDNAYHKSLWSNEYVNVLYLENYGYSVSKGWHKDVPYFGYRSPGSYLEEAVDTFNSTSDLGFKAKINIPESIYI